MRRKAGPCGTALSASANATVVTSIAPAERSGQRSEFECPREGVLAVAGPQPKWSADLCDVVLGAGRTGRVDALPSAAHPDGCLILSRSKYGRRVTTPLRRAVLDALEAISKPERRRCFWTGRSGPGTCAKYWRRQLRKVAAATGVKTMQLARGGSDPPPMPMRRSARTAWAGA